MFCYSFENLQKLQKLNLRANRFNALPSVIYKLSSLKVLDLNDDDDESFDPTPMTIDERILQLENLQELLCGEETIKYPPYAICQQGLSAVRKFFTDLIAAKGLEFTSVPIVFVGNSMAGKTSLFRSLKTGTRKLTFRMHASPLDEATRVFQVEDLTLSNTKAKLVDYGGNKLYSLAMQLLSRERCVPVIVVNIEEFSSLVSQYGEREAARRVFVDWLSHLYLVSPKLGSPILVLTHMDKVLQEYKQRWRELLLDTAEVIRGELLKEEGLSSSKKLVHVQYLSDQNQPLVKPEEVYEFSNDLTETSNIEKLKANLDARCKEFSLKIPRLWELVESFIDEQSEKPFITRAEIQEKFPNDAPFTIVKYMHNSGRLLWFEHINELSNYIFHRLSTVSQMIALLFDESSDQKWQQRIDTFHPFNHYGETIGIYRYESFVQQFRLTGVLDEALLFHLLSTNSEIPPEVAVELLKCFCILHGPAEHKEGNAYIIPYLSSSFMDGSWETDGQLQLRMDIVLGGLSLPWYVYQLTTIAVLKREICPLDAMTVTRNGATVHYGESSIHLVHDYNTRKITLQVSTGIKPIGASWKRLLETAREILSLLLRTWKACHTEVVIYCAHCLFKRDPKPAYYANPYWFPLVNPAEKKDAKPITTFTGIEPVACTRCATGKQRFKPSVLKPLRLPCKYFFCKICFLRCLCTHFLY